MDKRYFGEIIEIIKKQKPDKNQLSRIKTRLCSKYRLGYIPTDIEILLNAPIKDIPKIRKYLLSKPTRTISGVAVCAIMTKPIPCPHVKKGIGPCIMCPGGPKSVFGSVPQSYTGKEPATRRAIRNLYDPYLQVMNRLEQYIVQGHVPDKMELIIMGGTFPSFQKKYQEDFVKYAIKAMNDFGKLFFNGKNGLNILKFKQFFELPGDINNKERINRIHAKLLKIKNKRNLSLKTIQKNNEKSNIRNVALCIETRPDYAKLKQANEMLRLGCTRVELGVQTVFDDILKKIKRGHTTKDSVEATAVLKDLGFKISYHIMPGLPGVNKKQDLFAFSMLFANSDFMPDMLKIYPCMVLKGTKLYNLWKKGKYKPLTAKKAAELITEFKKMVPEYCRISRVQRDIPTFMTEAGVEMTNLRQYIKGLMKKKGIKCRCIRCREPKQRKISKRIGIKMVHYEASNGNEFFISAEDTKNDIILGFCRLRFPNRFLRKEINEDTALIRELHVYGEAAAIGKPQKSKISGKLETSLKFPTNGVIQHKGIGKKLLKAAEETAKMYYKNKMVVISGIGARPYYAKLGYKKEGPYMVKII